MDTRHFRGDTKMFVDWMLWVKVAPKARTFQRGVPPLENQLLFPGVYVWGYPPPVRTLTAPAWTGRPPQAALVGLIVVVARKGLPQPVPV